MGVLLLCLHYGIEPDLDYLEGRVSAAYKALPAPVPSHRVDAQFEQCQKAWSSSSYTGDSGLKALYKQATQGDCPPGKRPTGVFNASAKAEYDAHLSLAGMSREEAKQQFIQRAAQKGISY